MSLSNPCHLTQANFTTSLNNSIDIANAAAAVDTSRVASDSSRSNVGRTSASDNVILGDVDGSRLSATSLNGSAAEANAVFSVLEALLGGQSDEKSAALIETLNILKEDTLINDENSYDLLSAIMSCTEDDDVSITLVLVHLGLLEMFSRFRGIPVCSFSWDINV